MYLIFPKILFDTYLVQAINPDIARTQKLDRLLVVAFDRKNVKNLETYQLGASIYQEIKILPLLRWENSNFSFSDSSPIFAILRCYWLLTTFVIYATIKYLHSAGNAQRRLNFQDGGRIRNPRGWEWSNL